MTKAEMIIHKDDMIGDVVQKHPKTVPVFLKHGLHCIGCHASPYESIEQGAHGHGIPNLNKLIEELNEVVSPS